MVNCLFAFFLAVHFEPVQRMLLSDFLRCLHGEAQSFRMSLGDRLLLLSVSPVCHPDSTPRWKARMRRLCGVGSATVPCGVVFDLPVSHELILGTLIRESKDASLICPMNYHKPVNMHGLPKHQCVAVLLHLEVPVPH